MSMNIFRICGDLSHQIAIAILFLQLYRAKNARGISVKTQELRLMVFVTRYLDLFSTFYSLYNSTVKMYYLSATIGIIVMIKFWEPIKSVYNKDQDSFPHWLGAVLPCAILATATHLWGCYKSVSRYVGKVSMMRNFDTMELLWTFSIYLESIAILPQLMVLQKYGLVENLTGKFVFFLGIYRALYILNWVYRSHTEKGYQHHYVVYTCGVVQTLLYADFFYQYYRAKCRRRRDEEQDEETTGLVFEFGDRSDRNNQHHDGVDAEMGAAKESLLSGGPLIQSAATTDDASASSSFDDGVRARR